MSFFSKFTGIAGSILNAVGQVQSEVGKSGGDPTIQQNKKAQAVALVLATAHAGETVPNTKVQEIAGVVEFATGIASSLGLFGKTLTTGVGISIPKD
jgi:hypothetical protein